MCLNIFEILHHKRLAKDHMGQLLSQPLSSITQFLIEDVLRVLK